MIEEVNITNFESHKNSKFVFGPGFNLIYGDSNNGKSSALRAIELAAYGSWAAGENKKEGVSGPVRIGESHCEINVKSNKGHVTVKKGKNINEWEVFNKITNETVELKNPGAGGIPQAQEVLGLNTFDVADQKIRFNWSDQRDKHFLIDEVEGKSSSPSFVAAILDEVGGLSGCEDLIRSLASDKSKFEQKMRKTLEEISTIDESLIKFDGIDEELDQFEKAQAILESVENKNQTITTIVSHHEKLSSIKTKIKDFVNLKELAKKNAKAEKTLMDANVAFQNLQKINDLNLKLKKLNDRLSEEEIKVNIKAAIETYNKLKDTINRILSLQDIQKQLSNVKLRLDRIQITDIDIKDLNNKVTKASETIKSLDLLAKINIKPILSKLEKAKEDLIKEKNRHAKAEKILEDLLEEFDICPFCNQEITENCKLEILNGV